MTTLVPDRDISSTSVKEMSHVFTFLCAGKTSPAVLLPSLEPSTQKGHEPDGAGPEKGHKKDWEL